ncbi:LON peptidase substrate-binding domain-containing protein [Marinicella sp. W31]|uniref:LON peptidase substrate-binding domain-containing protein n=1 Tax=Marinicella sp. W31 TaxID=3023713 RepID=UPI003757FDF5
MTTESIRSSLDVALFPIPNMVAFPGTKVPLHIFEPRYRSMINDCVRDQRMLAISHTRKQISDDKPHQDLTQALSKNQASYEAFEVFSAGDCSLIETTEDGRMYVEVKVLKRLRLVQKKQEIPYQIVTCEVFDDEIESNDEQALSLQQDINAALMAISELQSPALNELLKKPDWQELTPQDFSFQFFRFIRFESDLMQEILESNSVTQRLQIIWERLKIAV